MVHIFKCSKDLELNALHTEKQPIKWQLIEFWSLFCTLISPFQAPVSTTPLVQVDSDFPDDSMQSFIKQ